MAKNNKLYKMLYEEYKLEKDVDFWLHNQSGSYIITHNAVKKIVAKQTEDGFQIVTPLSKDLIVFKNGSEGGMHGNEVVVGGDFHLKNKDGKIIRSVFRIGEANERNCKSIPYSWTMAEKRMYDRGVLDLLQMAQEGAYSDIEADDFKKKAKAAAKPSPEPAQAEAPVILPKAPAPTIRISPPEKKTPEPTIKLPTPSEAVVVDPQDITNKILFFVAEYPDGASKTDMWNRMHEDKDSINSAVGELLQDGRILKVGEGRGTKYVIAEKTQEVSETKSLTREEYNVLWREASEKLIAQGLSYTQIMSVVSDVTGCDSMIKAFKEDVLTKKHIESILEIGTRLSA